MESIDNNIHNNNDATKNNDIDNNDNINNIINNDNINNDIDMEKKSNIFILLSIDVIKHIEGYIKINGNQNELMNLYCVNRFFKRYKSQTYYYKFDRKFSLKYYLNKDNFRDKIITENPNR